LTFLQALRRSRWVRAGGIVLAVGWTPLLLFALVDWLAGTRSNPIGFGLLMCLSTPIGIGLVVVGAVAAFTSSRALGP
jgi:hypothetical protein